MRIYQVGPDILCVRTANALTICKEKVTCSNRQAHHSIVKSAPINRYEIILFNHSEIRLMEQPVDNIIAKSFYN